MSVPLSFLTVAGTVTPCSGEGIGPLHAVFEKPPTANRPISIMYVPGILLTPLEIRTESENFFPFPEARTPAHVRRTVSQQSFGQRL